MTTQINVIVDNGGLSAKAKQQTNANRWAKLEKDGKELVANRASNERENALARVGLDPKGNPLYGTSPQLQVRKDEPAATQQGQVAILVVPSSAFTATGIPARFRRIQSSEIPFSPYLTPSYQATAGPNSTGAIVSAGSTNGLESYGGFYQGDLIKILNRSWTLEAYMRLGSPATATRIRFGNQTVELGWTDAYGQVYAGWSINGAEPSQGDGAGPNFVKYIYPAVTAGQWVHVAMVQTATGYAGFFNGLRIFTADPVLSPSATFYGEINKTEYDCRAVIQIIDRKSINVPQESPVKPAVHGYRLTAGKTLYGGATYTPPAQITGFA